MYRGFESKAAYEKYYSGPLPQWELDAMAAYSKEAEEERENFKMSNETTKSCNLTEAEIEQLICWYGYGLHDNTDAKIERINYLNKRLKAFNDKNETKAETTTETAATAWPTNG